MYNLSNEKLFNLLKTVRSIHIDPFNQTNASLLRDLLDVSYREAYDICDTRLNMDPDGYRVKVREL